MTNGPKDVPARLRDRIFDAALAEVVESGIDEFDVAEVARRAGLRSEEHTSELQSQR